MLDHYSKMTAITLAEKIVYPLAANPQLLGLAEQRKEDALELIQTLRSALNGDPLISIVRCLRAGRHYRDVFAWGMGFFDEKGFFPELGVWLNEGDREKKLVRIMRRCPYGNAQQGWQKFLDFLFEENGGNQDIVAELLTPTFFPGDYRLLKEYLGKMDGRFKLKIPRETLPTKVLGILREASKPLSTSEVIETLGTNITPSRMIAILKSLSARGEIVQIGGRRRSEDWRQRGRTAFWTTSEILRKLPQEELFLYLPHGEKVLLVISQGVQTIEAICEATGLTEQAVWRTLKHLESADLILIERIPRKRGEKGMGGYFLKVSLQKKDNLDENKE